MTGDAPAINRSPETDAGSIHWPETPPYLRLIDWIWTVRGSLPLNPGQTSDEVFGRLEPFFREPGTQFERIDDSLLFTKSNQAAQDKMSVFDKGELFVERTGGNPMLRYWMTSKALLFCFLAPLLFLAFGQLTVGVGMLEGAKAESSEKQKDDKKDDQKVRALHPIDKALGAPEPEKPEKDKKDKKDKKAKDDRFSPTAAYVFAALFAALYVVGRVLEDWLIKRRFRRSLHA